MNDKINIGLIGVRGFGQKIASAILDSPKFNLLQCYHYDQDVCQEYAEKYSCASANSLDELMSNKQLDAVGIITPNYLHYEQVILNIYGTEGNVYCDYESLFIQRGRDINRVPSPKEELSFDTNDVIQEEIEEFADAIQGNASVETGFREGLTAILFVEGALKSYAEGCKILLDDID